ncbi:MAG: hypothetical protein AB8B77_03065 [Alphaproteobacteria bacterium]
MAIVSYLSDEEYNLLDDQGKLLAEITEAKINGDYEKAALLRQDLIIPAEALMALKRSSGAEAIISRNLRTETAEAKYGKNWLNQ